MTLLLISIIALLIYILYRTYRRLKHLQAESDRQFNSILELSKELRKDIPVSDFAWEIRRRRIFQALNRKTYTGK